MTEDLLAGVTEEFLSISWLQSAHEIACQSMFLTRSRDALLIHGWKNGFKQSVAEMAVTEMAPTWLQSAHDIPCQSIVLTQSWANDGS